MEASVLGFGCGVGQNEQVHLPLVSEMQLSIYLRSMVQEIKKFSYVGVFLQIDNLEILKKQDIPRLRFFFENIRDTLQIPGVYFVFIGNLGFFRDVVAPLPRTRSIFFGRPIVLSPLTKQQVVSAIHKRYRLLALPKK